MISTLPRIAAPAARTLRRRLLAALALGAFTLAGAADASGVQPCPHHADGVHGVGEQAAVHHTSLATDGRTQHHDHGAAAAEHDHGHHAGPHASAPTEPHGSAPPCDCEGACALAAQSVAVAPPASVPLVAEHDSGDRLAAAADTRLPGLPPFTLPYATAPPRG